MHLARWALRSEELSIKWPASDLHLLLSAERRQLQQLAADPAATACGLVTKAWAATTATLSPIKHPHVDDLPGWRDLELVDMVVLASSLGLPLVVFSLVTTYTNEAGERKRTRQKDYAGTIYHVGLKEEVKTMERWMAVINKDGAHWEQIVAKDAAAPARLSLVLTKDHHDVFARHKVTFQEVDYTKVDPDTMEASMRPMMQGAVEEDGDSFLEYGPRVWSSDGSRIISTSVLTAHWPGKAIAGDRLP